MTLEEEAVLSYYKIISRFDNKRDFFLVQSKENGRFFVKKYLTVYDKRVYDYIKNGNCPYFPKIEECIEDDGKLILIEEYVSGETLQDLINSGKMTSDKALLKIIREICEGLNFLHSAKPPIIHRDIKPSNIILTSSGDIKIIDVNISRTYKNGQNSDTYMFGTEDYAAPEQYIKKQSDARTDIYSLGVLINMLVTHKFPSVYIASEPYGHVVKKCTETGPENRYGKVMDVINDLEKPKKKRKHFFPFVVILVIAVIILIIILSNNKKSVTLKENQTTATVSENETTKAAQEENATTTSQEDTTTEKSLSLSDYYTLKSDGNSEKIYLDNRTGDELVLTKNKYHKKELTSNIPDIDDYFTYIEMDSDTLFQSYIYLTNSDYKEFADLLYDEGYTEDYYKGEGYACGTDSEGDRATLQYYNDNIWYFGIINLKR